MFGISLTKTQDLHALQETLTTYQRALEDVGWLNAAEGSSDENILVPEGFNKMLKRVRMYYYNNPLAGHWVSLTTGFVFGEGVSIPKSDDETLQKVIEKFWEDADNKLAFTSFHAQHLLGNKIQYEGNLFFMLFDDLEGDLRVRIMDTSEVKDIIFDVEDRNRPLFYKVKVHKKKFNFNNDMYEFDNPGEFVYYPDIENDYAETYNVPKTKLQKDVRILHVKVNCDINSKFGIPDLYRGIDWMKAHKDMSGDVATLVKALSKFAWEKKVKGGPAAVASIKNNMQSRSDLSAIRNAAGQTYVSNEGVDMKAVDVKTGGMKIAEEGLKAMQLQVCAASGIFYHYFGDPSTGNLATAKSMELPMVKKFTIYQTLWRNIYLRVFNYLIERKIDAGELSGSVEEDLKRKRKIYTPSFDATIDVDFPPILEADLKAEAEAYTKAKDGNLISEDLAATNFMLAANVNNIEDELEKLKVEKVEREQKEEEKFQKETDRLMMKSAVTPPVPGPGKPKVPPGKLPGKKPIKEAVNLPKKNTARATNRLIRKNNVLLQKMNTYRKALSGNFRALQSDIRNATKVSSNNGTTVGIVEHMDILVAKFGESMKQTARGFFPIAVDLGQTYAQKELSELGVDVPKTIYEANGRADDVLKERIAWNDSYIDESLIPAIQEAIHGEMVKSYNSETEFKTAVNQSVKKFDSRVSQYVGAFWTVEEHAVREAATGTGVSVNFVGADDKENCSGCDNAMAGNPWLIDEAPLPGEQQCLGNCRHALQIISGGN